MHTRVVVMATLLLISGSADSASREGLTQAALELTRQQAGATRGVFVTVGVTGPGSCDFVTLQAAIDSGTTDIRVVQGTYAENLSVTDRDILMTGGYVSCSAAAAGNLPMDPSPHLTSVDPGGLSALSVSGDTATNIVTINNMRFTGGAGFFSAGGINLSGDNGMVLNNVEVFNNTGTLGGGILVVGPSPTLLIGNSTISNNHADTNGGGIACTDGATLIMASDVRVSTNQADEHGGGIFADDCAVLSFAGNDAPSPAGIHNNMADLHGGGIYAENNSAIFIYGGECFGTLCYGSSLGPAELGNNRADADSNATIAGNDGDGGGIYATGAGTLISVQNAWVFSNIAGRDGGGIYAAAGTELLVEAIAQGCPLSGQCSRFVGNRAGETVLVGAWGGGIAAINNNIEVTATHFELNGTSGNGAAAFLSAPVTANFHSNLFFAQSSLTTRTPNGTTEAYVFYLGGGAATLAFNTFAMNQSPSAVIGMINTSMLNVLGSIIDDESVPAFAVNGGTLTADCSLAHETGSSGLAGISLLAADPFVDSAGFDFHILPASQAEDACDASLFPSATTDIDGNERGYDNPSFPNLEGPFDIGADETLATDIVFVDSLGD